jgi:hypothetical protein
MNPLKRDLKGHYVVIKGSPDKSVGLRVILCIEGDGCLWPKLGRQIVGEYPHDQDRITFLSDRIERIASQAEVAQAFDERGRIAAKAVNEG